MTRWAKAKRGRVAVMGPGRAGTAMARALAEAGYAVTLHGRDRARAARAARRTGVGVGGPRALAAAGVVLLAVPDDQLAAAARTIARDVPIAGAVVLHLAGAWGPEALAALAGRTRGLGVMHPLQSLSDPVRGARTLRGALFTVAGDRVAVREARRMATALGGRVARVPAGGRALYHAAASMASGGVAAVLAAAEDIMVQAGLRRATARRGLHALAEGTLAAVAADGPRRALTGPVARGDRRTLRRHREALTGSDGKATLRLYDALAAAARSLARRGPR